jgi:RimJ/RimL family protein N-acetyltransferase
MERALRPDVRPPERIELDDLLLRRVGPADTAALQEAVLESAAELHPWMPWCADPPDPAGQAEFTAGQEREWAEGVSMNLGIFRVGPAAGQRLLGLIGVHDRLGPGALEIGYWLRTSETGRGVMTRAARELTAQVLRLDGLTRAEIHCDEANLRSAAIPRRLGYRLDRIEDDGIDAPGETGRGMIWVYEG